jgi:anti-sigma factor RsiW
MPGSEKAECRPEMVQAYADGQLGVAETLELEHHLKTCANCAAAYRNHRALSAALADPALYYKAPPALRDRLGAALTSRGARTEVAPPPPPAPRRLLWRSLALAALAAFVVIMTATLSIRLGRTAPSELLVRDVVQSHVRSLLLNHLTDVPSSDQHTVKPWFNGKLDFSPPVKDLAADGFVLVGGRIDVIEDRPVAALIYRRRAHYINLFVWPSADQPGALIVTARRGFNVIHWNEMGMACWAVSDLNRAELQQFADLLRTAS